MRRVGTCEGAPKAVRDQDRETKGGLGRRDHRGPDRGPDRAFHVKQSDSIPFQSRGARRRAGQVRIQTQDQSALGTKRVRMFHVKRSDSIPF